MRWVYSGIDIKSLRANVAIALLRVFAGLGMALGHGMGKIPVSDRFIQGVGNLGFPGPTFFAWAAAISEFGGGLLLAIGLATRPAAFFLTITMATAAFLRHADDPFSGKEKALLYMVVFIMYLLLGSGRYGVDHALRAKRASKFLR